MNSHQFVKVFQIMADSFHHGAVLFSCAAGKDRIGIIAAMTLLLCGVSQVDMVADILFLYSAVLINSSDVIRG